MEEDKQKIIPQIKLIQSENLDEQQTEIQKLFKSENLSKMKKKPRLLNKLKCNFPNGVYNTKGDLIQ